MKHSMRSGDTNMPIRQTGAVIGVLLFAGCYGLLVVLTGGDTPSLLQVLVRVAVLVVMIGLPLALLFLRSGRRLPISAIAVATGVVTFGTATALAASGEMRVGLAVGITVTIGIVVFEALVPDRAFAVVLGPSVSVRRELIAGAIGLVAASVIFGVVASDDSLQSMLIGGLTCIGGIVGWWLIPRRFLPATVVRVLMLGGIAMFYGEGLSSLKDERGDPSLSHDSIVGLTLFLVFIAYVVSNRRNLQTISVPEDGARQ